MKTSNSVKKSMTKGFGVLIHCSDGWDRTSQVSCLVQILLVPHYRTIKGFCELFEKEFVRAGFNFAERCGFEAEADKLQQSPIVIQYLDCVHQLWSQHPNEFEYNLELLNFIGYHVYSAAFGNLIGRCDKERLDRYLPTKTVSIWSYILANKTQYENSFYFPRRKTLHARYKERDFRFWKEFIGGFDEYIKKDTPHGHIQDLETYWLTELIKLKQENQNLKTEIHQLRLKPAEQSEKPSLHPSGGTAAQTPIDDSSSSEDHTGHQSEGNHSSHLAKVKSGKTKERDSSNEMEKGNHKTKGKDADSD